MKHIDPKFCHELAEEYLNLSLYEEAFSCKLKLAELEPTQSQWFIDIINLSLLMENFESAISFINQKWLGLETKIKADIIENLQELGELGELDGIEFSGQTRIFLKEEIRV